MALLGRNDAWALMGIGAGIAMAHPEFAGNALAFAALPPALAAGSWLGWKYSAKHIDRVDTSTREGFILSSDDTYGDHLGMDGLRFGFTQDHGLPLDVPNGFLQRHTAIIGQSGVGKTTFGEYLLWQQTIRGGGWLFIDAKLDAETRDKLRWMAEAVGRGHEFYVLNVDDPENSNTYSPIQEGDPDEIASRLLNLLPSSEASPGADYYRQSANYALTVLVGAMQAAGYAYTFNDLAIMLQSSEAMQHLERLCPQGPQKMALQVFLDQFRRRSPKGETTLDVNKIKELLGGMSGRIAQFAQGKFGKVFNTYSPEINLTDIVTGGKMLYCMLPTMGKDTAALNLGKMIMSDLRTAVYKVQGLPTSRRPNPPFLVFADEMGSYVMPGIARLFEQARSANIMLVPAFQSFANLSVVSPDFSDIIVQNTWNKVFFKFASKDSPEIAAEIIGKRTRFSKSFSRGEGESTSASNMRVTPQLSAGASGNLSESWKETEDFRVTPDQLKALGMGEAVVVSGPRMYHIKTPMLLFPKPVPEFKVVRHAKSQPDKVLDFAKRYKEFLSDAPKDD